MTQVRRQLSTRLHYSILRTHSGEWVGVDESDFYESSQRLRVECVFDELSDAEASHFPEFIEWVDGSSRVRAFIDVQKLEDRVGPYDIKAGGDPEGSLLSSGARLLENDLFEAPA